MTALTRAPGGALVPNATAHVPPPGDPVETCALCLRLCRSACPVATATGREAATPTRLAEAVLRWRRGQASSELTREALALCVDCGACEAFCHLGQPLPEALREARAALAEAPEVSPLAPIEGEGRYVAITSDARTWAAPLAAALGGPVAVLATADALGHALRGHKQAWSQRVEALRAALAGRIAVVIDGDCASVLADAGVPFRWFQELVGAGCTAGCLAPGSGPGDAPVRVRCCGGAGPLRSAWPEDAARVGRRWLDEHQPAGEFPLGDARCARWLREAGIAPKAQDALDAWLDAGVPSTVTGGG